MKTYFIILNIKSACGLQEEVFKLLLSILVNMMIVVASSQNVSPSNIFFIELELWNVAFYCRMENFLSIWHIFQPPLINNVWRSAEQNLIIMRIRFPSHLNGQCNARSLTNLFVFLSWLLLFSKAHPRETGAGRMHRKFCACSSILTIMTNGLGLVMRVWTSFSA